MSEITLETVRVVRGKTTVLQDISFDVEPAERVAIIGPNGAGKTTFLRALAGHQKYSGSIKIDGIEVKDWKPVDLARRMSFVRQTLPIAFDFKALDVVLLGRAPHKSLLESYNRKDRDRASQLLSELDLSGMEERSILDLSGGERQRVLLAQALAQDTGILLLDEPTAHLDVHHKYDFMNRVKNYALQGITTICTMHDLQLAAQFADRVIVLDRGKVVGIGTPKDILTSEIISTVFRVDANIVHGPDDTLQIHYQL